MRPGQADDALYHANAERPMTMILCHPCTEAFGKAAVAVRGLFRHDVYFLFPMRETDAEVCFCSLCVPQAATRMTFVC